MKLEELQSASMAADQEADRQSGILRQLESELDCDGTNLSSSEYMQLEARCAQQSRRLEIAIRTASERRTVLDEARSAEAAKLQREMAQRRYDDQLNAFNVASATLATKRQELSQLRMELPVLEQNFSRALFSLDQARTELQRLPSATKEVVHV
jgi:hypothetical protein